TSGLLAVTRRSLLMPRTILQRSARVNCLGLARSPRVHWWRRFPMPGSSRAAASLPPGSVLRLDSTAPAARPAWDGSAYAATSICAPCVQGARSTLQAAINTEPARTTRLQRWIIELYGRKGYYKTLIAIANKHARILWAMLAKDESYDASAWQRHPMNQP